MSFELDIAAKRDPLEKGRTGDPKPTPGPYTAIALNGIFDENASQKIVRTVTDAFEMGADSVLIDMEDVSVHDDACLQNFAAALMSLRGSGRHVQVVAQQSAFHTMLAQAPDSRDWLRNFTDTNVGSARLAIHLDGPTVLDRPTVMRAVVVPEYTKGMNDKKTSTGLPSIEAGDVISHVGKNDVFLLDLRRATHGKQIYGAIRYDPSKLLNAPRLALPLPKTGGLIVVYDEDGTSSDVASIGDKLRANGYGEVRALGGGFKAYEAAKGKLEEASLEQPVPLVSERQVER